MTDTGMIFDGFAEALTEPAVVLLSWSFAAFAFLAMGLPTRSRDATTPELFVKAVFGVITASTFAAAICYAMTDYAFDAFWASRFGLMRALYLMAASTIWASAAWMFMHLTHRDPKRP